MKTNELTGTTLDYWVAKCEDEDYATLDFYAPSQLWDQGGPIIEREKITLEWTGEDWMAYIRHDEELFAPTPLIAAMRCYVASKFGDKVTE